MNTALEQSHVRMIISPRLKLSLEEKETLLRFCSLLGQLGPNIFHLYPEDEVPAEDVAGHDQKGTGLYGPLGDPRRVKLALPVDFKAPYILARQWEGPPIRLVFQSLLQLAVFLLCHEMGHRDAPINDEDKRKKYEKLCDANALVLMRDLGDEKIALPTREK